MSLHQHIQDKADIDLKQLQEKLELDFQVIKKNWDKQLVSIKKKHAEEIEQSIATQLNFQKFQKNKELIFDQGYQLQTDLEKIYLDIIPEILISPFVKKLMQEFLQDIPNTTSFQISGIYAQELKSLLTDMGYNSDHIDSVKSHNLGCAYAQLTSGKIELTIEDILNTVKQYTLPTVIQQI
jgi:hypothetical protein